MVVVVAVVVVVILILIVDVHVSEFRYLVDTDMIRGKKGNLVQSKLLIPLRARATPPAEKVETNANKLPIAVPQMSLSPSL